MADQAVDVPEPSISEPDADQRLAQDRFDLVAITAKADHRFRSGDHRAASAYYSLVVRIANQLGGDAASALRAEAMSAWLAARFRDHVEESVIRIGGPLETQPARFRAALQILFGERSRDTFPTAYPQLPKLFFYPGLPEVDFVDPGEFPWRSGLEGRFAAMREGALALLSDSDVFSPYVTKMAHRPQGDTHGMLENPDWGSFYFWQYGKLIEDNAARCPAIISALREIPLFDVAGRSPTAHLSLLRPGAHIPPHTGMLNCRYICHLPLVVPQGCRFRVGTRTVEWQEGRLLAFDDSVEHEAWNRGAENRVILLFEIWHPGLSEEEKKLIRTLLEAVDTYR